MALRRQTFGTMIPWILWTLVIINDSVLCFCPVGCLCDDETLQVTCDDANLEVIPITLNPSVQRLMLRRNKIRSIDTALRFYTELNFADFSNNKLVTIQNRSFEAQKKLSQLLLDHNKISFITNRTWIGLRDLSILSLRDNFLQSLEAQSFATVANLRHLDLGQNRIEVVHPAAFEGLTNLRSLLLDDNRLSINQAFFPDFLQPVPSLAELNLAGNSFEILPDGIFSSLPGLGFLDLRGSGIKNVSSGAFRNLTQLRHLQLDDNSLTEIPFGAWHYIPHLEHLTLGQNPLVTIPEESFNGLLKLQTLEINGAPLLTRIDPGTLQENLDLRNLHLSHCKRLAKLPENFLTHLPLLKEVHLKDNALTDIPDNLADWYQLNVLDLSGNPLTCSCGLKWLRDVLSKRQSLSHAALLPDLPGGLKPLAAEVTCSSPADVSSLPLGQLTDEQLGCRGPFTPESLMIAAAGVCSLALVLISLAVWRYRRNLARVCGGGKKTQSDRHLSKWKTASPVWGVRNNSISLIGQREPMEFQKTCPLPEEECFMRAVSLHSSFRSFPRTEL